MVAAFIYHAIAIMMSMIGIDYYIHEENGFICQEVKPDAYQCKEGRQ